LMQNPLVLHHEKMGATLQHGRVPLRYSDTTDEYWALRKSSGLADLSHLGRLTVKGKDRVPFLNGLLTNDITKLKENGGIHSVLLNAKARVLADLYLNGEPDSILIDSGESDSDQLKKILDQFIITEDVKVENSTQRLVLLTLQGPLSAKTLEENLKVDVASLGPLQSLSVGPSLIIARDRTGQGGYDILIPSDEAEAVWQNFLLKGQAGPLPVGMDALEILRLEAGLPRYGVDVDENTIVLEAGYQEAISFTKGCYMGQEVVARATHIGRVNRRLVRIEVDTREKLKPGSRIIAAGSPVGSITSSAFSPGLEKTVALGYVGRDQAVVNQELEVENHGSALRALVTRIV
jgi:folate-binding protein YgfZ